MDVWGRGGGGGGQGQSAGRYKLQKGSRNRSFESFSEFFFLFAKYTALP